MVSATVCSRVNGAQNSKNRFISDHFENGNCGGNESFNLQEVIFNEKTEKKTHNYNNIWCIWYSQDIHKIDFLHGEPSRRKKKWWKIASATFRFHGQNMHTISIWNTNFLFGWWTVVHENYFHSVRARDIARGKNPLSDSPPGAHTLTRSAQKHMVK